MAETFAPILERDDDAPWSEGGNTAVLFTKSIHNQFPMAATVRQCPRFRCRTGFDSLSISGDFGDTGVTAEVDPETGRIAWTLARRGTSGQFTATVTATSKGGAVAPPFYTLHEPEDGAEDNRLRPRSGYWRGVTKTFTLVVRIVGSDEPWIAGERHVVASVGEWVWRDFQLKTTLDWDSKYSRITTSCAGAGPGADLTVDGWVYGPVEMDDPETGERVGTGLTVRWPGLVQDYGLIGNWPVTLFGFPTRSGLAHFTIKPRFALYAPTEAFTGWSGAGEVEIEITVWIAPSLWPNGKVCCLWQTPFHGAGITLSGLTPGLLNLNGGLRRLEGVELNDRPVYEGTRTRHSVNGNDTFTYRVAYLVEGGWEGWVLWNARQVISGEALAMQEPTRENAIFYRVPEGGVKSLRPPTAGWKKNGAFDGTLRVCAGDYYLPNVPGSDTVRGEYPFWEYQGEYNEHAVFMQSAPRPCYLFFDPSRGEDGGWVMSKSLGGSAIYASDTPEFPPVFSHGNTPFPKWKKHDGYVASAYGPPRDLDSETELAFECRDASAKPVFCGVRPPVTGVPSFGAEATGIPVAVRLFEFFPRHWELKPYPYGKTVSASAYGRRVDTTTYRSFSSSASGGSGARCNQDDPEHPFKQTKQFPERRTRSTIAEDYRLDYNHAATVKLDTMSPDSRVVWLEHRGDNGGTPSVSYAYRAESESTTDGALDNSSLVTTTPGALENNGRSSFVRIQPVSAHAEESEHTTDIFAWGEARLSSSNTLPTTTTSTYRYRDDEGELQTETSTSSGSISAGAGMTIRGMGETPIDPRKPFFTVGLEQEDGGETRTSSASVSRSYSVLNEGSAERVSESRSESVSWSGDKNGVGTGVRQWSWSVSRTTITFDSETGEITNQTTDTDGDSGQVEIEGYVEASVAASTSNPGGSLYESWSESESRASRVTRRRQIGGIT